jgi:hypothetical protein
MAGGPLEGRRGLDRREVVRDVLSWTATRRVGCEDQLDRHVIDRSSRGSRTDDGSGMSDAAE